MVLGLLSKSVLDKEREGGVGSDVGDYLGRYLVEALSNSVTKCLSPYVEVLTYRLAELCDESFLVASEVLARDLGESKYLVMCRDLRRELLKLSALMSKLGSYEDVREGLGNCEEVIKCIGRLINLMKSVVGGSY